MSELPKLHPVSPQVERLTLFPVALPRTPRTSMQARDFAGWTPAGLDTLARVLRVAKERREQAAVGAAFDAARGVTP